MPARNRLAILLTALLTVGVAVADAPPTPLQQRMQLMGDNLKKVVATLRKISITGGNHDAQWASVKTLAEEMAVAAGEAKTLFPPNVAGNSQLEKEFTAALDDIQQAITSRLVKAAEQKELADANDAVNVILQKRKDAHDKFIPPHP